MDNQHQKIKGYRDLSQAEIDLMNAIKAKGMELEALVDKVRVHVEAQQKDAQATPPPESMHELTRLKNAEPGRWASIGRTHFQEGLMALTRAVAQPSTF